MPEQRQLLAWTGGLLVCALTLAAVAKMARLPVGREAHVSELRLALRSALARVEICRDRTPEELADLAAHLRSPRICDEIPVNYRLVVSIDGLTRLDRAVRHSGVRRTRPLTVDEAIEVEPGTRQVEVRFEPELAGLTQPTPGPIPLRLSTAVDFRSGRARLVKIAEGGELELVVAPDAVAIPPDSR